MVLVNLSLRIWKKGDSVFVLGELRNTEWEDKSGEKRFLTAVYAKECQLLVYKSTGKAEENSSEDEIESDDQSH